MNAFLKLHARSLVLFFIWGIGTALAGPPPSSSRNCILPPPSGSEPEVNLLNRELNAAIYGEDPARVAAGGGSASPPSKTLPGIGAAEQPRPSVAPGSYPNQYSHFPPSGTEGTMLPPNRPSMTPRVSPQINDAALNAQLKEVFPEVADGRLQLMPRDRKIEILEKVLSEREARGLPTDVMERALKDPKLSRFVDENRSFTRITDADRYAFEKLRKANPPGNRNGNVFVNMENPILGEQNSFFKNPDLVDAMAHRFNHNVLDLLERDSKFAALKTSMKAKYNDGKSIQFIFSGGKRADTEALVKLLYEEASKKTTQQIYSTPLVDVLKYGRGMNKDANWWHLLGMGESADEAALQARMSRPMGGGDVSFSLHNREAPWAVKVSPVQRNQALTQLSGAVSSLRARVTARIRNALKNMPADVRARALTQVTGFPDRFTLSQRTVELTRKIEGDFVKVFQERFMAEFGVAIDAETALMVRDYISNGEKFSANAFFVNRETLDLASAPAGIWKGDQIGAGSLQIQNTLEALAQTEGKALEDVMIAARKAEEKTSHVIQGDAQMFDSAALKSVGGEAESVGRRVGDDFAAQGREKDFTTDQLRDGLRDYRAKKIEAAKKDPSVLALSNRSTHVPGTYLNSTQKIPGASKSSLIGIGEKLVRDLRMNVKFSLKSNARLRQVFDQIDMALEVRPALPGTKPPGRLNMIVSDKLDAESAAALKSEIEKLTLKDAEGGSLSLRGYTVTIDQPGTPRPMLAQASPRGPPSPVAAAPRSPLPAPQTPPPPSPADLPYAQTIPAPPPAAVPQTPTLKSPLPPKRSPLPAPIRRTDTPEPFPVAKLNTSGSAPQNTAQAPAKTSMVPTKRSPLPPPIKRTDTPVPEASLRATATRPGVGGPTPSQPPGSQPKSGRPIAKIKLTQSQPPEPVSDETPQKKNSPVPPTSVKPAGVAAPASERDLAELGGKSTLPSFRAADPKDSWTRISSAAFNHGKLPGGRYSLPERISNKLLGNKEAWRVALQGADGREIGYVVYRMEGESLHIEMVKVEPAFRGKDYSTSLLAESLRLNPGAKKVETSLVLENGKVFEQHYNKNMSLREGVENTPYYRSFKQLGFGRISWGADGGAATHLGAGGDEIVVVLDRAF